MYECRHKFGNGVKIKVNGSNRSPGREVDRDGEAVHMPRSTGAVVQIRSEV